MTVMIGRNRRGTPNRVIDLLTSEFGEWFSIAAIVAEFERRWPDVPASTVRKAVRRLYRVGHEDLEFKIDGRDDMGRPILHARGRLPSS